MWAHCSSFCLPPIPMFFFFFIFSIALPWPTGFLAAVFPPAIHTLSMDAIPQCKARFPTQENHIILVLHVVFTTESTSSVYIPFSASMEYSEAEIISEVLNDIWLTSWMDRLITHVTNNRRPYFSPDIPMSTSTPSFYSPPTAQLQLSLPRLLQAPYLHPYLFQLFHLRKHHWLLRAKFDEADESCSGSGVTWAGTILRSLPAHSQIFLHSALFFHAICQE